MTMHFGSRASPVQKYLVPCALGLFLAACSVADVSDTVQLPAHPLDGLTERELALAVELLQSSGFATADARYHIIDLHEPPKADVLNWEPGSPFSREAFVVLTQPSGTFEAVIDLTAGTVAQWRELQPARPNITADENEWGEVAIKSHPDWQAAMRRRGITDFDYINCTPVISGFFGVAEETGRRLGKAMCYDQGGAWNYWGRPIEGLTILIDLNRFEVVRVIDTGSVAIPDAPVDYDAEAVGNLRAIPAPISIAQPDGAAFDVTGHEVSWQKWKFHFRIDPRVGVVISQARYDDAGTERSILYQASLSEIFVPYMDPDIGWYWRTYLDAGEFLAGNSAAPLIPGVDCPDGARYFDAAFANVEGTPYNRLRAACLFERYAGNVAWRHYDGLSGKTETRKKRDLVLRFVTTLGNYDYTFDWTFQQDGTIGVAVGSSGIEQVKAVASRIATDADGATDSAYGRFVGEHIVATNHDHFFNFRLDFDVDGTENSFSMDRMISMPLDEDNPRKSVWVLDSEIARTEQQGRMRINFERPALWRVINPGATGPLGYPASYQIKPGANAVSLLAPDDIVQLRAGFTDYHVWVTPYRAGERFAAGDYPGLDPEGDGLPVWTAAGRPIENTDIVVWYTLGHHHVVRAEDWPVLPTSWSSFELRPFDFFDRNPALDLPPGPR